LVGAIVRSAQPHIAIFTEACETASFDSVADEVGPHRALSGTGGDREGVMVVSRWPFLHAERCGPACAPTKWVKVTVKPFGGPPLTIVGVSLVPQPLWPFELWRRFEVGALLDCVSGAAERRILAGDFNSLSFGDRHRLAHAPSWVRAQWLLQAGTTPRWALPRLTKAGYVDCYRACNATANGFTVPAWDPQVRIDYLFASSHLREALRSCAIQRSLSSTPRVVVRRTISELLGRTAAMPLGGEASDHLAVWADFEWPEAAG
jgi:endonuclease/exonuclease/phosphatase family metal-dependent hydrolase